MYFAPLSFFWWAWSGFFSTWSSCLIFSSTSRLFAKYSVETMFPSRKGVRTWLQLVALQSLMCSYYLHWDVSCLHGALGPRFEINKYISLPPPLDVVIFGKISQFMGLGKILNFRNLIPKSASKPTLSSLPLLDLEKFWALPLYRYKAEGLGKGSHLFLYI